MVNFTLNHLCENAAPKMSFVTVTTLVLAVDGASLTCQAAPDVPHDQADGLCHAVAATLAPAAAPAVLTIAAAPKGLSAWLEISDAHGGRTRLPRLDADIVDQPALTDTMIRALGAQLARAANDHAGAAQ